MYGTMRCTPAEVVPLSRQTRRYLSRNQGGLHLSGLAFSRILSLSIEELIHSSTRSLHLRKNPIDDSPCSIKGVSDSAPAG